MDLQTQETPRDFNGQVKAALDSVIFSVTGSTVLDALYQHLKERYSVTPDEVPYRLNTVLAVLESVFGFTGTRTIGKATAKRLFQNYGLNFEDQFGYDLPDYVELCKKRLEANST